MKLKTGPVHVSREDFLSYEFVRKSGAVNMYHPQVRELAGLTREQHLYIIEHYRELRERYADEDDEGTEA